MSIRVISWVWESSQSSGIDRLVLLAIADAASGDDGSNAYPSIATLARKAKVSSRTVQRSIRVLCDLGELKMSAGAGRNGSNLYKVVMRQPDTLSDSHPRQPDTRTDDTPPVKQSRTPVSLSPNPRHAVTQSVLDPSLTKGGKALSPYCDRHQPNGTDMPCRDCGIANAALQAQRVEDKRQAEIDRRRQVDTKINADIAPPRNPNAFKAARATYEASRQEAIA